MIPNLWIFSLEPLDSRYTGQWHQHIPTLLKEKLGYKFNVIQIDGVQKNSTPTPGAFLNFSDTNYWKSSQLLNFLEHYNNRETTQNDYFLFTDAWNPVCIQIKYMSALLGLNWKLGGLFHAGSYDPGDYLGRLIGDAPWVRHAEKSFFNCYDHNYFATDFHIHMFVQNTYGMWFDNNQSSLSQTDEWIADKKIVRTGWPMEYMQDTLAPFANSEKENLVLFPHRIAPEKQIEIFKDLEKHIPEAKFIVCQEQRLTKDEYHTLLGKAKIVFSASLQETLGISMCAEGPLARAIPIAPNRLSYREIFDSFPEFLYPQEWSESWGHYELNKEHLIAHIKHTLRNYNKLLPVVEQYLNTTYSRYFFANDLINTINDISFAN